MYKIFVFLFIYYLIVSCKKDNNILIENKATTILYIEANNDLKNEAIRTINDIEEGLITSPSSIVLVYIKDNNEKGVLLKIRPDNNIYKIVSDTLMIFPFIEKTNGRQINTVLNYIKDNVNSEKYNLILWSHGTSWFPNSDFFNKPRTKAFGQDRDSQIDIIDLKNSLPITFDLIVFDACAMASIEVLYEFKDKANYIISSPTDILSEGFPYKEIIKELSLSGKDSFIKISEKYFNYYNSKKGLYQSCTISLVDASKLNYLATHIRNNKQTQYNVTNVQRLDFSQNFPVKLYDFQDFFNKNYNTKAANELKDILDDIVVYKNHTPNFIGNIINTFSGITISYIDINSSYYDYYLSLQWNKNSLFME